MRPVFVSARWRLTPYWMKPGGRPPPINARCEGIATNGLFIGLDVLRRKQLHLVPERAKQPRPVMRSPHASIPTTVGGSFSKNATISLRRSFLRSAGCSAAFTP